MPQSEFSGNETEKVIYEESPLPPDEAVEPGINHPGLSVTVATAPEQSAAGQPKQQFGGGIIRAAMIISLGNILTRIFGLARESVLAGIAGTAAVATAFSFADNVLTIFFDLLVSGAISSALIPVLSRYAAHTEPEKRKEFWHIVNTLMTLGLIFLLVVVGILQIFTTPLATFMTQGQPEILGLTEGLIRIILFGIIFLGVSSIMMATLQALQRFAWTALSLSARNASVVIIALLFSQGGVWSMVIGVLVGTLMLVVLQAPGLKDMPFRPSLDWRHPAIREILRLYMPIFLGLMVTSTVLIIDRALAGTVNDHAVAAMRYATTLQQFTLGLVGSAISIAILPTLSRQAANVNLTEYRQTLMSGLKLLMVLILPATIGLLAIALPTISVIFEHGKFDETSRVFTFVALIGYLPGIPAAAADQMLIFSFYARKNTLTPVLVGVVSNLTYLGAALLMIGPLQFGMIGLVLANSLQQVVHMTIMFILLRRVFGGLRGDGLISTIVKALLASLLLGVVAYLAAGLVNARFGQAGFVPNLLAVSVGVAGGGLSYLFALRLLKVTEMTQIWGAVSRKIRG